MNAVDAVEDGGDAAAEFVIVAVIEALQVYLVEIEPGAHVVENLRSAVAVGDESGKKSGGLSFFENRDRPFAGDQRLVVGADQDFCALIESILYQSLRRSLERRRNGAGVAQGLRRDPDGRLGAGAGTPSRFADPSGGTGKTAGGTLSPGDLRSYGR